MYDDDYGAGGCLTLLIIVAVVTWISDNWEMILLVVVIFIALGAAISAIRSYNAKAPEREAAAKAKAEQEAAEKEQKERASYDRYFAAQEGAHLNGKLDEANSTVRRLLYETDEAKRAQILAFFDKYLPLVTEIIEASKHGAADIDEPLARFTETVQTFTRTLYKADEVIDLNKAIMESMAIKDGLYDPYAEDLSLHAEEETVN